MSADNGIYILFTNPDTGPEYRVAYANAIDNIYGEYNEQTHKYDGNIENIKSIFGESQVFYTLNEAFDFAEQMEYEYDGLEYGVNMITDFKDYGFVFTLGDK